MSEPDLRKQDVDATLGILLILGFAMLAIGTSFTLLCFFGWKGFWISVTAYGVIIFGVASVVTLTKK